MNHSKSIAKPFLLSNPDELHLPEAVEQLGDIWACCELSGGIFTGGLTTTGDYEFRAVFNSERNAKFFEECISGSDLPLVNRKPDESLDQAPRNVGLRLDERLGDPLARDVAEMIQGLMEEQAFAEN